MLYSVSDKQSTEFSEVPENINVSLPSSSSSASDMRGLLTEQDEEDEEGVDDTPESTLQIMATDETNKDESHSVVVELDKCSADFDESSDKDSEEVSEPVTQIEVNSELAEQQQDDTDET